MSDRRGEVSTPQPLHAGCQAGPSGRLTSRWTAGIQTALGEVRVFWSQAGLLRLCLPGDEARALEADEAPLPAEWGPLLRAQLEALASGSPADFRQVPLDLGALTPFQREVLAACAEIPWGQVLTYGELAQRTGRKAGASRAVGAALSRNPVPLVVPCHRVTGASGKLVGFTAPGGLATKRHLLTLEGVLQAQATLF